MNYQCWEQFCLNLYVVVGERMVPPNTRRQRHINEDKIVSNTDNYPKL
jgi:hypothetical protein